MAPFFSQDLGSSLLSLFLNSFSGRLPISTLLSCLGFYLVPSSGTYSSTISLCLTFCDCDFCSTGCRVVVHLVSAVCPLVDETVLRGLCRFPSWGVWYPPTGGWSWGLSLWWERPYLRVCLLLGSCLFRTTLSRLSADGWGCVPTLLVVWPESQHWSLQAVGWGQVLVRKQQPPRGLMPINTCQTHATSVPVPPVNHSCPLPPQETLQH